MQAFPSIRYYLKRPRMLFENLRSIFRGLYRIIPDMFVEVFLPPRLAQAIFERRLKRAERHGVPPARRASILSALGTRFERQHKLREALDKYRQVRELEPRDGSNYLELALVYGEMQEYEQAVSSYKKALEFLDEELADWRPGIESEIERLSKKIVPKGG